MADKIRLDVLMTEKGLAQSREKAKAMIMAGIVFIDNQKCDKAGLMVAPEVTPEDPGQGVSCLSLPRVTVDTWVLFFS